MIGLLSVGCQHREYIESSDSRSWQTLHTDWNKLWSNYFFGKPNRFVEWIESIRIMNCIVIQLQITWSGTSLPAVWFIIHYVSWYMHSIGFGGLILCCADNALSVMLVLGLGLAIGWPWPWDSSLGLGLGLRGLALAKNSRPKSWQTTMFTMNFHRLEWIIFQVPRSLLTYRGHLWPFVTVQYQLHSQLIWPWPWDCGLGLGLDSVWPWPWSVGLGLECSGLVNITGIYFGQISLISSM